MNVIILGMKSLLDNHALTIYERSVIESMLDQAKRKGRLSEKQISFYDSIASNYTEFALVEKKAWEASFDEVKKKNLRIIANYYLKQGTYFVALAEKVLEDESYIPPRKSYAKMCENKYAKRILEAHYKTPRYSVGDIVYPVTKCPHPYRPKLLRGAVVLRPDAELPITAAKGAKRYLVLPVGDPHGVIVEERWLKSRKDKTNGAKGSSKKRMI